MEEKRFLIIWHNPDDGHRLRVANEQQVSDAVDMADCHGEGFEIFWLDDDGKLQPVETGKMTRYGGPDDPDCPFYYGTSPLIASGQVVGYVSHTDH